MSLGTQQRRAWLGPAILAVITLLLAGSVVLGAPTWLAICAAAIPWVLIIASRRGFGVAAGGVAISVLLATLAVMMVARPLHIPLLPTVVSTWAIVGLVGSIVLWKLGSVVHFDLVAAAWAWAPASLGSLVWLGVMAATNFVPGAARLSWLMQGDSANNVLFAREIIAGGGVAVGANANPVPLPSALMAIVMEAGRGAVSSSMLTLHDLSAFAQVWIIVIALVCFFTGAAVGKLSAVAGGSPRTAGVLAAGASLIPLSWFVSGYPFDYGFFNTSVALLVMMAAILCYFGTGQKAAFSLATQFFAATLLLAIWSPLVLLPLGLALALTVTRGREILRDGWISRALLGIAILQVALYGFLVALPGLVAQSQFLSAPGGAFAFRRWVLFALAAGCIILAVAVFRRLRHPVVVGTASIVAACLVSLGALLFVTRNAENPWSYYPLKCAWLGSVVLAILLVGLAGAFISRHFSKIWLRLLGAALIALVTLGFLHWSPSASPGFVWKEPLPKILSGEYLGKGDQVTDRIARLSNPDQANVLWKSGNPNEGTINFWVLQLWADSMSSNIELKRIAYGLYDPKKTESLCTIVALMGGKVNVYTADSNLRNKLMSACPSELPGITLKTEPTN